MDVFNLGTVHIGPSASFCDGQITWLSLSTLSRSGQLCVQQLVLLFNSLQTQLNSLDLRFALCMLSCKGSLCLILRSH